MRDAIFAFIIMFFSCSVLESNGTLLTAQSGPDRAFAFYNTYIVYFTYYNIV